mgnify:CR=1 FL=1
MIEKLLASMKDLDIRVYTLTSGKAIIGECYHAYEDGIELHCALEIKRLLVKSGVYSEVMLPLVSGNEDEPCIIYDKAIETETFASDTVKRKYAEALIYNRLCQMMDADSLQKDLKEEFDKEKLEKSFPELDKQKQPLSQEELLNIFLERWKQ